MKQVTKKQIFIEEYLPPLVATMLGCIVYIVLLNLNLSSTSPSQVFLFIVICLLPALFFTISAGKIRLPPAIKIAIYIYGFLSNLLATTFNVYAFIPVFDTILHSAFGFLCGFLLIYILVFFDCNEAISFLPKAIIILLATAGIGAFWEVIEYICDVFAHVNSQHSIEEGLLDTMQDTFCNLGGACLFQVFFSIDHLFLHNKIFDKIGKSFSRYLGDDNKPVKLLFRRDPKTK